MLNMHISFFSPPLTQKDFRGVGFDLHVLHCFIIYFGFIKEYIIYMGRVVVIEFTSLEMTCVFYTYRYHIKEIKWQQLKNQTLRWVDTQKKKGRREFCDIWRKETKETLTKPSRSFSYLTQLISFDTIIWFKHCYLVDRLELDIISMFTWS